ncbi:hypothetical protein DRP05_15170 [Archaeoglobales archaeon]|nr:MAG: hypothetical protein DRP05_15170 [Archaeoglobales archaeon]
MNDLNPSTKAHALTLGIGWESCELLELWIMSDAKLGMEREKPHPSGQSCSRWIRVIGFATRFK